MTSRLNLAAPAIRPALPARAVFSGPPGAGKTRTSLIVATVLAEGGDILLIDTEQESALTYADDFTFTHLPWRPPFDPKELAATITDAGAQFAVIVVDSLSHFWRGEGGVLDIAGGKFSNWKDARPAHETMVQALLDCKAHFIGCARSKVEHVQETGSNGRQVVRKLGMAVIQDDSLEYELNVACELDMDHSFVVSKSRTVAVPVGRVFKPEHAERFAEEYRDWLKGGEPSAPGEFVEAIRERIAALPDDVRKECKAAFVAALGRPDTLPESRMEAADVLVARFEERGGGGGDGSVSGSAAAPPPPENAGEGAGTGEPGPAVDTLSSSDATGGEESGAATPSAPASFPAPDPSGGVTADDLRAAVALTHPDRDTTRKQEITAAKIAAQVAGALSISFAGGFDDIVADQTLAAAVLADLRGDDKPPPPGGKGPAVGEQPPAQAPDSGPAPADPAPTAAPDDEPVPLKTEHRSDWGKENAYCQAVAADILSGDPETLKSQREALAYQASGGRVTSWSEVTRSEFSQIRSWLQFIAGGHGRLVESNVAEHFGWEIRIEEAA